MVMSKKKKSGIYFITVPILIIGVLMLIKFQSEYGIAFSPQNMVELVNNDLNYVAERCKEKKLMFDNDNWNGHATYILKKGFLEKRTETIVMESDNTDFILKKANMSLGYYFTNINDYNSFIKELTKVDPKQLQDSNAQHKYSIRNCTFIAGYFPNKKSYGVVVTIQ